MSKRESLPVIFRAEKAGQFRGEVSAVFPTEPATSELDSLTVFDGAHCSGSLAWYQSRTRPARPEEYAPLLATLRRVYEEEPYPDSEPVSLKVCQRITSDMTRKRHETANQYRSRGL